MDILNAGIASFVYFRIGNGPVKEIFLQLKSLGGRWRLGLILQHCERGSMEHMCLSWLKLVVYSGFMEYKAFFTTFLETTDQLHNILETAFQRYKEDNVQQGEELYAKWVQLQAGYEAAGPDDITVDDVLLEWTNGCMKVAEHKNAQHPAGALGTDPECRAVVQQWLEIHTAEKQRLKEEKLEELRVLQEKAHNHGRGQPKRSHSSAATAAGDRQRMCGPAPAARASHGGRGSEIAALAAYPSPGWCCSGAGYPSTLTAYAIYPFDWSAWAVGDSLGAYPNPLFAQSGGYGNGADGGEYSGGAGADAPRVDQYATLGDGQPGVDPSDNASDDGPPGTDLPETVGC